MHAQNDNRPEPALVRVIGYVAGDGAVTVTDPTWRPTPQPAQFAEDRAEAQP